MPLTPSEVAKLETLVDGGRLAEIVIEQDGVRTVIGAKPSPSASIAITAPAAGTVTLGSVSIGQPVRSGDELARIVVLDDETAIEAPAAGEITAILVDDGALVGYGAELFLIALEESS